MAAQAGKQALNFSSMPIKETDSHDDDVDDDDDDDDDDNNNGNYSHNDKKSVFRDIKLLGFQKI